MKSVLISKPWYFPALLAINFCWVNTNKEGQLEIVESPFTCKDYLTDCMYVPRMTHLYFDKTILEVNYKKTQVLIYIPDILLNTIPNALKVLNGLEKELKFKQTTITKVKINNPDNHAVYNNCTNNFYLVESSGQWMKNTFLVSTFLTLLRLSLAVKADKYSDIVKQINNKNYLLHISDIDQLYTTKNRNNFTKVLQNLKVWNRKSKHISGYDNPNKATHSTVGIFYFLQYGEQFKDNPAYKNFYTQQMLKALKE